MQTASVAEARGNFSKIAALVSETGQPVTVFRHSKPWVRIVPAYDGTEDDRYIDVMDSLIASGLDDYAAGRCISGVQAARCEVERRAALNG